MPASPLASTARSMAFLKNTMGVSDANAVCVDLWPHVLKADKGGPSANAELNATAKAQESGRAGLVRKVRLRGGGAPCSLVRLRACHARQASLGGAPTKQVGITFDTSAVCVDVLE